jgi:poly-beta-1,6-N-acetyl-D-glucosamine biosynthesis protein PgaD
MTPSDDAMSAPPIINARHRLRWHQRLVSDGSTLLLWGAWLKLWLPLLRAAPWFVKAGVVSHLASTRLAPFGSSHDVGRYALALAGTSGTLLLWNQLPAPRRGAPVAIADDARHFGLPEAEIRAGRAASICVVHHDEAGRIVRLEPRAG